MTPPWEAYPPGDPRANPFAYDDSGRYLGPPVAGEPDPYVAGTIGNSGYDTSGPPRQPAYIPESSAYPPATSPAARPSPGHPSQVSPDVRWAPAVSAPAAAPATAPPTITDGWTAAPEPVTAPAASAPSADQDGYLANATAGADASDDGWGEPTWGLPATAPQGSQWDTPQFARYFSTLGASQPERVERIRGLPGSVAGVRPQGAVRQRPRGRYALPPTAPSTMPTRRSVRRPARRDAGTGNTL